MTYLIIFSCKIITCKRTEVVFTFTHNYYSVKHHTILTWIGSDIYSLEFLALSNKV